MCVCVCVCFASVHTTYEKIHWKMIYLQQLFL